MKEEMEKNKWENLKKEVYFIYFSQCFLLFCTYIFLCACFLLSRALRKEKKRNEKERVAVENWGYFIKIYTYIHTSVQIVCLCVYMSYIVFKKFIYM